MFLLIYLFCSADTTSAFLYGPLSFRLCLTPFDTCRQQIALLFDHLRQVPHFIHYILEFDLDW